MASGAISAARQVGGVIGVALLGTLVGGTTFVSGMRVAVLLAGLAFLAGALLTALVVSRRPGWPAAGRHGPVARRG